MARAQVTVPLDIPDVRVLKTELNERGELIITIESTKTGVSCRRCGHWIEKFHGHDGWVILRHLPVFGRSSYLRYRPRRYQCLECEGHPTTTQSVDWHDPHSPHTFAYDEHLLLELVGSTVMDVSLKERLSYDAVLGALERRIEAKVDWLVYSELGVLGMDEIALKKGHRDFVTIVTARLENERVVLLGVLPGREKEQVVGFLRSIPQGVSATIHTVCCDMYEGYSEAVREELPQARIVVDRFHVTRHYHQAADDLRQSELKRLKRELSETEYQALKGSMWAFRKKAQDLKPEERQVLRKLFKYAPQLKRAYELREQLTTIFDLEIPKAVGKKKLRTWIKRVEKSGLQCFDKFLKTLDNWWEEITNYFIDRASSGFVEGLNNKLKVLKRRCYGIFNLNHLFQRIYLDLEGYRLFAGTPPYLA
ncbi:MAG: ISL3 family transposase [Anaerolineales bacterium]